MDKNVMGIYQIKNTINGKVYIGSSIDIRGRWWNHKSMLRRGTHDNIHLQRAWNKDGCHAFKFSIIERIIDADDLLNKEQWYIDNWKPEYNIADCAMSPRRGVSITDDTKRKILLYWTEENRKRMSEISKGNTNFKGRKHSKESKMKMSKAAVGKTFSKESREKMRQANLGKVLSSETRRKIRESNSGDKGSGAKLNWNDVIEIREMYRTGKYSYREIGEVYFVARTTICAIVNHTTWKIGSNRCPSIS